MMMKIGKLSNSSISSVAQCLIANQTSAKAGWLPIEILSHIFQILFDQEVFQLQGAEWSVTIASSPFLSSMATPQLLVLRLVCKTWAIAATPICFRTVWFQDSKRAQIMIDLMKGPVQSLDVSSFVKRLAFKDAWFLSGREEHIDPVLFDPIPMDQVVELIRLIGQNVTELYLHVSDSIMITSALVKASKNIKNLKKLSIEGRRNYQPCGYEAQAFSDLLVAHPKLECLILQGYDLANLTLEKEASSNLKHLSFLDCLDATQLEAIIQICTLAKHSLKSIELVSYDDDWSSDEYPAVISPIFEPILNTLEFLSCDSLSEEIPYGIIYTEFPQLRVIHLTSFHHELILGNWPILRHVRTIAQPVDDGQEYWRSILNRTSDKSWKPPKLRLIVFTNSNDLSQIDAALDFTLINALKLHGIDYRFLPKIKPDELLELDLRFNVPMK
ncbi:hypothetical protein DFH28DRAFT_1145227 [Melampsora americana]|nr:hypothetical protein DFH28DRAFT_1145227 [Melampsora americana]